MTYTIKFPIGDWSDDGHGKCEWFHVESNKPVETVREAHFNFEKKADFKIGDMCGDYEVNNLDPKISTFLHDNGLLTAEDQDYEILVDGKALKEYEEGCEFHILSCETLLKIWLRCLQFSDPELELKIVPDEHPTIHFYGCDWQSRHLDTPGYGLFN